MMPMEGHDQPCYYCGEPCNTLAGSPDRWPVALCHRDNPGRVKWHHTGCVTERLIENGGHERAAELQRENTLLRNALLPFATMADQVDEWQKGTGDFAGSFDANDLRKAQVILFGEGAETSRKI